MIILVLTTTRCADKIIKRRNVCEACIFWQRHSRGGDAYEGIIEISREGGYDKRTKTIEVMTKVSKAIGYAVKRAAAVNGLCPHCHTYCHGDCLASR